MQYAEIAWGVLNEIYAAAVQLDFIADGMDILFDRLDNEEGISGALRDNDEAALLAFAKNWKKYDGILNLFRFSMIHVMQDLRAVYDKYSDLYFEDRKGEKSTQGAAYAAQK